MLFACLATMAFSQKVSVGVKAGADLHKMDGKSFDEEFKFGYHLGGFVEIKVKKIGVQPEIYFSQVNAKQGKDFSSIFNTNGITKTKLSYLNIPILANFYFNQNVALQLGPQFSALVNENATGPANVKDAFKKGDFSAVGGLQIKISRFRVFGRYVIGLNNLNDVSSSEKWKSQTVHLGVGYAIL